MPNSEDKRAITLDDFRKLTEHLDGSVPIYVETEVDNTGQALGVRVELSRDEEKGVRVVVG
jgi:hypothetical protein